MRKFSTLVIASLAFGSAASGHPGHGEVGQGFSLAHYLTEPIHVFVAVVAVLGAVATGRLLRSRART